MLRSQTPGVTTLAHHRRPFGRRCTALVCITLVGIAQPTTTPSGLGPSGFVGTSVAFGQCCGEVAAAPVVTQTYRLQFQTVYDERQVNATQVSYETVYDTKTYTVSRPVWETQTTQRRSTVQRPVWETSTREERFTVMKPVWETVVQDRSYDQVRDVVETSTREERFTVMKPVTETVMQQQVSVVRKPVSETVMQQQVSVVRKPVTETAMQQQVSVVRKPVYETAEREEAYTVAEPVTTLRTAYADQGGYVDQVTPMVAPGSTQLAWVPGGWAVNPYNGLATWQRGGYGWTMTPGVVVNQVNRVYQPNVVAMQVPETTVVNRVVTRKVPVQTVRYVDEQVVQQVPVQTVRYVDEQVVQQVPVQTVRYVDEQVVQQVPVQTTRMVAEEQVRQVPVQTVRKVVERVENKVPVQVCRMVAEEQVRQVPVQTCRFVTEEKVEPVTVQVLKYVNEQKSVQVPRVVEKRTPYSYTVRMPRTVVLRVPLDPCGNPLPTAAVSAAAPVPAGVVPAATYAPAASAGSGAVPAGGIVSAGGAVTADGMGAAAAARPATAPPALSSTEGEKAVSTFSEKPAAERAQPEGGWTDSPLDHVDPSTGTSAAGQAPATPSSPAGGDAIRLEKPTEPATKATTEKPASASQGAANRSRSAVPAGAVETIPAPLPTPVSGAGHPPVAFTDPPLVPVRPAMELGLPAGAAPPALPALKQGSPAADRDAPRATNSPAGAGGQTT